MLRIRSIKCKSSLRKHLIAFRSMSKESGNTNESEAQGKSPPSFWDPDANIAPASYKNRWLMAVPAFLTHMSIGSPWAWSIVGESVTRELGFVAPAALDWTMAETAIPMSFVFLSQGVTAAAFGKWQQRVGARRAMATAACMFGGGLGLGALGLYMHNLYFLYAGYGIVGGTGMGLAYTPPVQTLLQWFPDKKGIASGLTIAGFGSGALLFGPAFSYLSKKFSTLPEYLGPAKDFTTSVKDGILYAEVPGRGLEEVVLAGATELAKLPYELQEGLYLVGSGSTGAAPALATMGALYFSIIMGSALSMLRPHEDYMSKMMQEEMNAKSVAVRGDAQKEEKTVTVVEEPDISVDEAMKTPQFWLLGTTFLTLTTGGFGLMSVAKTLMNDVFSGAMPLIVTSAFAGQYVMILAANNLGGRLAWAQLSDMIGRPRTFSIFTLGSIPLFYCVPTLVDHAVQTGSVSTLYAYIGATGLAVSVMGGAFAVLPAYEADLFGSKNVGPIHGRMLMFTSVSALSGPSMLLYLRTLSERAAVEDLMAKLTPEEFLRAFGAPIEQVESLLTAKTVTIAKLMEVVPPGTLDPTPHLYDTTMFALTGLAAASAVAHAMVRPLPSRASASVVIDVHSEDSEENKENKEGR